MRVFAVVMLTACMPLGWIACTPASLQGGPLSEREHARAEERGRRFAQLRLSESERPYKLQHLTEGHPPRIHLRMDTSLLVLSGTVRVRVDGERHELDAGDSVDIPHGAWYSTQSLDENGSSVFFAFEPARETHSTRMQARAVDHEPQALAESVEEVEK